MKITGKQAKDITFEDTEEFEIEALGDWVDEGKCSYCNVVFSKDGKFYSLDVSRSGSYFTDWDYDWGYTDEYDCPEVEQVEVTVTQWRLV